MELRIIIAGSRDFYDYQLLKTSMKSVLRQTYFPQISKIEIVSGTARGADQLGEKFAKEFNLEVKRFPAAWDLYGKRAGRIRNEEMAKYAISDGAYGLLVAFWDGESRGTKSMIDLAREHGLAVRVVKYKDI